MASGADEGQVVRVVAWISRLVGCILTEELVYKHLHLLTFKGICEASGCDESISILEEVDNSKSK